MVRPRVALSLATLIVAMGLAAGASSTPAVAASVPTALSKACRALQAKAIEASAASPANGPPTADERAFYAKCPGVDTIVVVSLGNLSGYQLGADAKGRPVGIAKITSSNQKVVAVGKPVAQTVDGKATNATVVQAVGLGQSRVCFALKTGSSRCLLVVGPRAITGKAGGRTLNVAFGSQPNDAAKVVSITSSDPSVVSVATDPSSSLPYVVLSGPGTTTICAKYTKGRGGCQQWTIAP